MKGVFGRSVEVDDFLLSHALAGCDYCEEGWFGTKRTPPGAVKKNSTYDKMNFILADRDAWSEDGGRRGPANLSEVPE